MKILGFSVVLAWGWIFPTLCSSTLDRYQDGYTRGKFKLSNTFPTLDETVEMAAASLIVYAYRNELDDDHVCHLINKKDFREVGSDIPAEIQTTTDIHCHWYMHDRVQGTQVMVVASASKRYNAIVFAGTDNMRTALTDVNIATKAFGDGKDVTLPAEWSKVHIHAGFDNGVFSNQIYEQIEERVYALQKRYPSHSLFTTGHSLGAAESILAAVALTLGNDRNKDSWIPWRRKPKLPDIHTINFGCPRTGNIHWRTFVNNSPLVEKLSVWRFVLGWDLVPRLPDLFNHVGHTIQINKNGPIESEATNATAEAYYQHLGNTTLGLAGVPFGWSAKPYIWVPGSLLSHHVDRYWRVLHDWASSSEERRAMWVDSFEQVDDSDDYGNDDRPPNVDDDFWVDPPDDDLSFEDPLDELSDGDGWMQEE